MSRRDYRGILCIGDPHLASRVPGFRKDDYPRTILSKLAWCLEYAHEQSLLPTILGDLFDRPRDNANWLLGEVLAMLDGHEVIAIHGNHDCRENDLMDDDTLTVVSKARKLHLLDRDGAWQGEMNGRPVVIGGTPWGRWLPKTHEAPPGALVFWLAHHNVIVPGYEEQGRFKPHQIPGIDAVINGHIHRHLEDVQTGQTLWLTPGNITRVARSDATRQHTPSALRIDITPDDWQRQFVAVPHAPFEEVFHPEVLVAEPETTQSAFVRGLAELQARRTDTGAGLMQFLQLNLDQFDKGVADEVLLLAKEVTADGTETEH